MIFLAGVLFLAATAEPARCTYEYSVWNASAKASLRHVKVDKLYADLTPAEKSPTVGCTPCREDQKTVTLSNGLHFEACRALAAGFEDALEAALSDGAQIVSVVGY